MIDNCGLMEFSSLGNTLSWSGRRWCQVVKCRLDRAPGNNEWHNLFPCSFVEYLCMVALDHGPTVATIEDKIIKYRRFFRFDKNGIGEDGIMESITWGWNTNRGRERVGVVDKIHWRRYEISAWRKLNPPYGKDKIDSLQRALEEIQNHLTKSHEEVLEVSRKLQNAYRDEEQYWEQKSRTNWHVLGDRNTKFYHASTKQRRIQNLIIGLHNEEGNCVNSEQEVEGVAVRYFTDLFSTSSPAESEVF